MVLLFVVVLDNLKVNQNSASENNPISYSYAKMFVFMNGTNPQEGLKILVGGISLFKPSNSLVYIYKKKTLVIIMIVLIDEYIYIIFKILLRAQMTV